PSPGTRGAVSSAHFPSPPPGHAMRLLLSLPLVLVAAVAVAADPYTVTARAYVTKTEERTVQRDGQAVTERVEVPVEIAIQKAIDPAKCAVVICDMWDDHWCKSAAARCDALAKKAGP